MLVTAGNSSNRWTEFSTGSWDWNVGLDYLTGTTDTRNSSDSDSKYMIDLLLCL